MRFGRFFGLFWALALTGLALSACATSQGQAANDPYEATNREIFALNQKLDRTFLRRTATMYRNTVPEPVRSSVRNVITNIDLPAVFANDLLQGEGKRAKETALRFVVNSTLGLGGILDVASRNGIPFHREDFGQTLAVHGAGEGPFLMLPILGPSNPRDAAGLAVDVFALNPFGYIHIKQYLWWELGRNYMKILDLRSRNIETLESLERSSVDYYSSMRSLYRQLRNAEIRNGQPDEDLPDY